MFGWHEAAITFSIGQKARWEALLAAAGIAYRIKTLNRRSPSPFGGGQRGRTGTLGESLALEYEYRFLVRQGDWERAREILEQPQ